MRKGKRTTESGQQKFDNMPERSDLGKKAVEYINQLDRIEGLKVTAEGTRKELINLFRKEGESRITVEGRVVSYAHVENDKVSIKQKLDKEEKK